MITYGERNDARLLIAAREMRKAGKKGKVDFSVAFGAKEYNLTDCYLLMVLK